MNNREKDARLYELLAGVKSEMRLCDLFGAEVQSFNERGTFTEPIPGHMEPCWWDSDWRCWRLAPYYSRDIETAYEAEGKLCERGVYLRDYREALAQSARATQDYNDDGSWDWDWWDLHRATAEQRVDAMLIVLEAVKHV